MDNNIKKFKTLYKEKISRPLINFSKDLERKFNNLLNINQNNLTEMDILVAGLDNSSQDKSKEIELESILILNLIPDKSKLNIYAVKTDLQVDNKPLKKISPNKVTEKVASIYGRKPQYHFMLGYEGFKGVINELNGVEIKVKEPLKIKELELNLNKGKNTLNGQEALNYAR